MVKETIDIIDTRIEMKKEETINLKGNQFVNDIKLENKGLTRDLSKSALVDTILKKSDKNGY